MVLINASKETHKTKGRALRGNLDGFFENQAIYNKALRNITKGK